MRIFLAEFVLCAGRQSIYAHFDSRSMMSSASCGDEHKILPPTVLFNDPHTWPKHWTQSEIERLLRSNLVNPASPPNYASLATLFHRNDFKSLALLVRTYTKPPAPSEVDLEQNLRDNLNNVLDSAAMPLQERSNQLDALDIALLPESEGSLDGHQEGNNTVPLTQKRGRRNVVCCTSPRGSGKTQFIKRFVLAKRAAAMKCGRVIVRCCDKTAHHTTSTSKRSWVTQVLDDRETTSSNLEKRQHLQSLTEESFCLHARST
ncbi:Bodo-specific multi-copy gene family, putative, partial [Bodo saltans]